MDEHNVNQQQAPNTTPTEPMEPMEKKSSGPLVGIVIIVLVLAAGGYYFWSEQVARERQQELTPEEIQTAADPTLEALEIQSTSDEVTDIEADLNATELGDLDAELRNIDLEFDL